MKQNKRTISINEISRIRKIINLIIELLEKSINKKTHTEEDEQLLNTLIGNKESMLSAINKLTNLLVKIIPLEYGGECKSKDAKLSNEDLEIIKRYIKKCGIVVGNND